MYVEVYYESVVGVYNCLVLELPRPIKSKGLITTDVLNSSDVYQLLYCSLSDIK